MSVTEECQGASRDGKPWSLPIARHATPLLSLARRWRLWIDLFSVGTRWVEIPGRTCLHSSRARQTSSYDAFFIEYVDVARWRRKEKTFPTESLKIS
jgi:hypothetical protein